MSLRSMLGVFLGCLCWVSCSHGNSETALEVDATRPTIAEHERTLRGLRPPKRARPMIAILADNAGTETTDFLVPYAVLAESNVADVIAVAPTLAPITLMPALTVRPEETTAGFDERYPAGADYVVVPAMHRTNSPVVIEWIRAQAASGATIVAICSGAMVVAEAGLLENRSATTHWFDIDALLRKNPTVTRVENRRYVVDRGVVTTTGVTASVPVSLALVEAIAGRAVATKLARRLGAGEDWRANHDSSRFRLQWRLVSAAVWAWLSPWRHESIGIRVESGVDEIALAFAADAYSRTYLSQARTFSRVGGAIEMKRGLELIPDLVGLVGDASVSARIDELAPALPSTRPVAALDATLDQIQVRYGEDLAKFVALQLEYSVAVPVSLRDDIPAHD